MTVHIVRINDSIEKTAFRSEDAARTHVETTLLPDLERRGCRRDDTKFEPVGTSGNRWCGGPYTVFLDTLELHP